MHSIAISFMVILFFIGALGIRKAVIDSEPGGSSSGGSAGRTQGVWKTPSDSEQPDQKGIGRTADGSEKTKRGVSSQDADTNTGQHASAASQEKKKIALTFDDGPDAEYTPLLLDGLAERGVKATFFVIGEEAEANPALMKRLVQEGHLIGNHTYSHVDLKNITESAAREEIRKANEVIEQYTGEEPCFLRPPFGSASSKIENEMEMIQVLWTIDTMDWSCKSEESICSTVYREIQENSIILMHDEYPATVRSALSIIDNLQEKGYEFVTVDKIIWD